ncbi:hypothetical protein LXL04_003216 [Taraxacum kok-saghyz]
MISNMPDAILVLILSRLSSTEEQIRSSILSRRWRYLWTAIPSVDMEFVSEGKFKKCEFKEFVYWVLASKTVDLDRFRLFLNDSDIMSTVWWWVHLAVTRNTKQIDLSFGSEEETEAMELPHYLVSCGSLEVLRLDLMSSNLRLPRFVGFPVLRVLDLTCVDLPEDGDLVKDFLKSCPLLEDLSLSCCFIGELVCISCPKLKRLSIVNWDDVGPHGSKISCPKLVDLELGGCIMYGIRDSVVFHGNYHFKWAHLYFSFEDFNEKCVWLDEAELRRLLNPDVKKVEFFEFNGEKPKVVKECCEVALFDLCFEFGKKIDVGVFVIVPSNVCSDTIIHRNGMYDNRLNELKHHNGTRAEPISGMKNTKRPKASKREDGVDLISNMSDAILLLIISRLSSTEEQIRTSILSRRWRYLWTAVPSLRLQFVSRRKINKKSEFKEFTYWVLASKTVDLDSFRLRLNNDYSMSTIWRWVHLAVMRNVKQLDLSFRIKEETEAIDLPRYLVNCDSLEVLRLDLMNSNLSLPRFVGFSALKVLDLTEADLPEDDDLVNDFLKNCPLLEDLSLSIDGACDLALPNLKTMLLRTTMEAFTVDELIQLLKYCPKLENLTLIIRKVHFDEEYEWVDEAETRRIWTRDVKRVEFFKFSGERPKLDIEWLMISLKSECEIRNSVLEEELSTLNKKLQIPSDENALLEAMKAKVADLIPVITEFDFKTEAIGKQALHEILKVKQEILLLQKYHASQQAKILHLQEKVKLGIAEISRRDEQITELNSKINKLINSHLDEEDRLNTDIESLDCWIGNGMNKSERPKASKGEDGVDLISNMPDAILLLILSRLSSTEEQIRSSILSRRWRYLWTAVPSVDMQLLSREESKQSEFKEFMYWVLASKTVNLDSFRLSFYKWDSIATVWRWVHLAVMRNVKQIDLLFGYKEKTKAIELPHYLVSCGSLEVLKLDLKTQSLSLPRSVGFPALRVLHLTYVDLPEDDDLVNNFLRSCPLLEDLVLFCWKSYCIDAAACNLPLPNLKTLVLRTKMGTFNLDELTRVLKCCPKLENLTLIITKDFDEDHEWMGEAEVRRIWYRDVKKLLNGFIVHLILKTPGNKHHKTWNEATTTCYHGQEPRLPPTATIATVAGGGGGRRNPPQLNKTRENEAKKTLREAKENSPLAKAVGGRSPLVVLRCTTAGESGGKAVEAGGDLVFCCRCETASNRSCRFVAQPRQVRRRLAAECISMKKSERPKASKREDGVDLISKMPDAILLLILSRLSSTGEQIRSSILSRRWRYLWTAVPSVDMQFLSEEESKQSQWQLLAMFSIVITMIGVLKVQFDSSWCIDSIFSSFFPIHHSLCVQLKSIDFRFQQPQPQGISQALMSRRQADYLEYIPYSISLEVLRLDFRNHGLSLPKVVGFPALRVLHLTNVCLPEDDDLVNDFLKSCPLLEDLSLVGCLLRGLVCISYPNLNKLKIINWDDVGCHSIKISCPKLVDFDLGGCILKGNREIVQFLGNSHFKWAHLYFFWKSIDAACDLPLPNLKTLVLRTTMEAFTVDELIRILKCCPKLENLTLIITKHFDEEYEWVDEAETRRIWTRDVERVEFFEFKAEKPKLNIEWNKIVPFADTTRQHSNKNRSQFMKTRGSRTSGLSLCTRLNCSNSHHLGGSDETRLLVSYSGSTRFNRVEIEFELLDYLIEPSSGIKILDS